MFHICFKWCSQVFVPISTTKYSNILTHTFLKLFFILFHVDNYECSKYSWRWTVCYDSFVFRHNVFSWSCQNMHACMCNCAQIWRTKMFLLTQIDVIVRGGKSHWIKCVDQVLVFFFKCVLIVFKFLANKSECRIVHFFKYLCVHDTQYPVYNSKQWDKVSLLLYIIPS